MIMSSNGFISLFGFDVVYELCRPTQPEVWFEWITTSVLHGWKYLEDFNLNFFNQLPNWCDIVLRVDEMRGKCNIIIKTQNHTGTVFRNPLWHIFHLAASSYAGDCNFPWLPSERGWHHLDLGVVKTEWNNNSKFHISTGGTRIFPWCTTATLSYHFKWGHSHPLRF